MQVIHGRFVLGKSLGAKFLLVSPIIDTRTRHGSVT
jgi:hypothetical protein